MSYNNNISSPNDHSSINLENYEMYFMMYIDRELCEAEMAEVDAFLLKYPYLQIEMDQLKATILSLPNEESVVLPNKNQLFKKEDDVIDAIDGVEEKIILATDNELNDLDWLVLQKEISVNSEVDKLFQQYQQTILPQEKIEFPNKNLLFKAEEAVLDPSLEEKIILATDQELNQSELLALQKELSQNPAAEKLFQQYQSTVLPKETIVFPNKQQLYKSGGKTISIFRARWVELSIAAAVALFVVVNVYNPQNTKELIKETINTPSTTQVKPADSNTNQQSTEETTSNTSSIGETTSRTSNVRNVAANVVSSTEVKQASKSSIVSTVNTPQNNIKVEVPTEKIEIEKKSSEASNISNTTNVQQTNTSTETVPATLTDEEFFASFEVKNDTDALIAEQQLQDLRSLMATNDPREVEDYSSDPIPLRGLFKKVKNEVFKHNRNSKNSYSIHFK